MHCIWINRTKSVRLTIENILTNCVTSQCGSAAPWCPIKKALVKTAQNIIDAHPKSHPLNIFTTGHVYHPPIPFPNSSTSFHPGGDTGTFVPEPEDSGPASSPQPLPCCTLHYTIRALMFLLSVIILRTVLTVLSL